MDFKRFRNVGMWMSISSLVVIILQNAGVQFDLGQYTEVVNKVLELLVFLGILSNPKDGMGYLDTDNKDKE